MPADVGRSFLILMLVLKNLLQMLVQKVKHKYIIFPVTVQIRKYYTKIIIIDKHEIQYVYP